MILYRFWVRFSWLKSWLIWGEERIGLDWELEEKKLSIVDNLRLKGGRIGLGEKNDEREKNDCLQKVTSFFEYSNCL